MSNATTMVSVANEEMKNFIAYYEEVLASRMLWLNKPPSRPKFQSLKLKGQSLRINSQTLEFQISNCKG